MAFGGSVGIVPKVGNGRCHQPFELRDYQKALAETGSKQNIIVCLPTGSGKTIIAVTVMNSPEIKHEVLSQGRKIIFIVNTVQLANQQANYIHTHTEYNVLMCTSDTMSGKTPHQWQQEMKSRQVLVMIAQICADQIKHNVLNFPQMALLVLDECHNATKMHNMNDIMHLYHKYVEANPGSPTPRIIGLTATINKKKIKGDITEGRMALEIESLEKKLAAKAVISDAMDEVLRHSTESEIKTVEYNPFDKHNWDGGVEGFKTMYGFIDGQRATKKRLNGLEKRALNSHLPNISAYRIFTSDTDDVKKELRKLLLDFVELYENIGPLACSEAVGYKLEWLHGFQIKLQKTLTKYESLNIHAVKTQLLKFHVEVNKRLEARIACQETTKAAAYKSLITYKMECLLQILSMYSSTAGTESDLLGLVFVKRRSYAIAIKTILEIMGRVEPEKYGFIKPELVTGTNNNKRDVKDIRVSTCEQKRILESFRHGQVNLIICTTVLEEGIDVPSCNLVVRFDEIHAYTSFIQSMGRARKRGAKFFVLTASTLKTQTEKNLNGFIKQHRVMNNVIGKHRDMKLSLYFPGESLDEDPDIEIDDFVPYGESGPKITASSAIALVHRYIQKDKAREILSWHYTEEPDPKKPSHKFRVSVWITGSPIFSGVIKGSLMQSVEDAKKSAFMEVCHVLCSAGALDKHHLLPN